MRVHISINVSSLERSTAFYSALFDQQVSKSKSDYANFRLDQPPIHLALMERGEPGSQGVGHLGIELPDHSTLDEWHQRLKSQGVNFLTEDGASCCYAKADKLWLTDPDGYRWEIWTRTGEHDALEDQEINQHLNTKSETAGCPVHCCN